MNQLLAFNLVLVVPKMFSCPPCFFNDLEHFGQNQIHVTEKFAFKLEIYLSNQFNHLNCLNAYHMVNHFKDLIRKVNYRLRNKLNYNFYKIERALTLFILLHHVH